MLRAETQELDGALICRLQGRFTGEGAEQVRTLVTRCDSKLELVFDLTEILFIDAVGEEVLWLVKNSEGSLLPTQHIRAMCANGFDSLWSAIISITRNCQVTDTERVILRPTTLAGD